MASGHLRTVHFGKEIRKNPVKTYGDDFIVGDRVWVNGVKPGYIQYLGETHFGDGDWAGVVLDEPVGKNDGSVRGKRYFYCEPKRGIFCRLHRLTRYPDLAATATDLNESSSRCGSSLRNTPSPCSGSLSRVPLRSSLTSRRDTKLPRSPLHDDDWIVGDRVWVNGTKPGYIQFLGETHFGEGDWAGVVLDDPIGKNDGSVRGKRYFYCEPKRGVFCRLNRLKRYPDIVQRSPSPSRVYTSSITVQRASTPTKKYTSSITIQRSPSPSRVCTLHHFSRHSTGTLTM